MTENHCGCGVCGFLCGRKQIFLHLSTQQLSHCCHWALRPSVIIESVTPLIIQRCGRKEVILAVSLAATGLSYIFLPQISFPYVRPCFSIPQGPSRHPAITPSHDPELSSTSFGHIFLNFHSSAEMTRGKEKG